MTWTNEQPTKSGNYWFAPEDYPAPVMVYVALFSMPAMVHYFSGSKVALLHHRGRWCFVPVPSKIARKAKAAKCLR